MNPEDLRKMSDEELDDEIKKTRKANKKAIDDKDRSEERKTLATLNMLEDERLDRERKKNTSSKSERYEEKYDNHKKNANEQIHLRVRKKKRNQVKTVFYHQKNI